MPGLRYFTMFILSCTLTLIVFVLMQQMLNQEKQLIKTIPDLKGLDFVRLIRDSEPEKKRYETKTPKKPEPPRQKPPPPKLQQMDIRKPQVAPIAMPSPRLQTHLNLNDALYLGVLHKAAPIAQSVAVDEEVIPLVRIAPQYPARAARLGIEGWVKMSVLIDSQGRVESVTVIEAKPERIFNRAAIKAIKRWRFRPKVVNGQAVSRTAEQQINFKLNK